MSKVRGGSGRRRGSRRERKDYLWQKWARNVVREQQEGLVGGKASGANKAVGSLASRGAACAGC
eukprot:6211319-Pleurochrysis_carterae.AAC.3